VPTARGAAEKKKMEDLRYVKSAVKIGFGSLLVEAGGEKLPRKPIASGREADMRTEKKTLQLL